MNDYELLLADRIGVIRSANEKYDLEHNAYLSFSGGKDSTILHYLLDIALPHNNIPRVFIDTGIEYLSVRRFVTSKFLQDKRFVIIRPSQNIQKVLQSKGYPFKSKEFANIYRVYQHNGKTKSVLKYLNEWEGVNNRKILCPKILKPLFDMDLPFRISDSCCKELKKKPIASWEKSNNRFIGITGMRREEGGQRLKLKGCILTDDNGNVKRFHPLLVVDNGFEDWFIKKFDVKLASIYYPPFNFKRTGCKCCPFSLDLKQQLETLKEQLPFEYEQCEQIWKEPYALYRKIGYRL